MKSETLYHYSRVAATVGLVSQGAYYAFTSPGISDLFNAIVHGLACYAIWFARERTK